MGNQFNQSSCSTDSCLAINPWIAHVSRMLSKRRFQGNALKITHIPLTRNIFLHQWIAFLELDVLPRLSLLSILIFRFLWVLDCSRAGVIPVFRNWCQASLLFLLHLWPYCLWGVWDFRWCDVPCPLVALPCLGVTFTTMCSMAERTWC